MPVTQATISTTMGSTRSSTFPLGLAVSPAASAMAFTPENTSPFSRAFFSCLAMGP